MALSLSRPESYLVLRVFWSRHTYFDFLINSPKTLCTYFCFAEIDSVLLVSWGQRTVFYSRLVWARRGFLG